MVDDFTDLDVVDVIDVIDVVDVIELIEDVEDDVDFMDCKDVDFFIKSLAASNPMELFSFNINVAILIFCGIATVQRY